MAYSKDDVSLYRYVLAERVSLTDTERQEIADEWNKNEAARQAQSQAQELEQKRIAAVRSLQAKELEAAMADPAAPQEVKDYAAALGAR